VKSAVSWIVEWVKGKIEGILNAVWTPIQNGIQSWAESFIFGLDEILTEHSLPKILEDSEEAIEFISDILFGQLFLILMGLSITLQIISLLITVYTVGLAAGASLFTDIIVTTFISTFLGLVILGSSEEIIPGIYAVLPDSDDFWTGGLGLAIQGLWFAIRQKVYGGSLGADAKALSLALFGLFIHFASLTAEGNTALYVVWGSFILAALGFGISTIIIDPTSDWPGNPLKWVEEIMSGIAFGYALQSLLSDFDNDGVKAYKDKYPNDPTRW
jgi:hypothetical protein